MAEAVSWDSDAPLVIAHRGASARAPENTMAAFHMAESVGADAVELDAKLTRDGQIIIHHDRSLDRTTDGRGFVARRSLEEIRKLDAGSHFDDSYAGERVPTLREVLEGLGERMLFNVELTNYAQPFDPLPRRAFSLVEELGLLQRVLFSSFNPLALWALRGAVKRDRLALLLMERQPNWLRRTLERTTPHGWVHPQYGIVAGAQLKPSPWSSVRVNVWTVNEPGEIQDCVDMGVDGVITDVPDVAAPILQERRASTTEGRNK
jgi:glycerophosphoryl diester phosphodiesterase